MATSGLARGILALLGLALVLFTFNHARLIARDLAHQRLEASRETADQVQASVEAAVLDEARRLAAAPRVAQALDAGELAAAAAAARRLGPGPEIGLQAVSVDENLRVTTSGTFKRSELWDSMRGALESGESTGLEREEGTGRLAVTAAVLRTIQGGGTAGLAVARPIGSDFADAIKRATGLDTSIYSPDGIRRATTLVDPDGSRADGEAAAGAPWRRWERRREPLVTATIRRASAFDPLPNAQGGVAAVRELIAPLDYGAGFRGLLSRERFLVEVLLLALAAVMAVLLGRGKTL